MTDPESMQSEFSVRDSLESEDGCVVGASQDLQQQQQEEEDGKEKKQGEESKVLELRIPEFKVEDDQDDGFRTPTSMDHKIPVTKQCPPAPRKPKTCSMRKRKAYSSTMRCVRIDLSKELELMFPSLDTDLGHKMKKSRCDSSTATK